MANYLNTIRYTCFIEALDYIIQEVNSVVLPATCPNNHTNLGNLIILDSSEIPEMLAGKFGDEIVNGALLPQTTEIRNKLDSVISNTSNISLNTSTLAKETTLTNIKAKTDNLDVGLSTLAKESGGNLANLVAKDFATQNTLNAIKLQTDKLLFDSANALVTTSILFPTATETQQDVYITSLVTGNTTVNTDFTIPANKEWVFSKVGGGINVQGVNGTTGSITFTFDPAGVNEVVREIFSSSAIYEYSLTKILKATTLASKVFRMSRANDTSQTRRAAAYFIAIERDLT